MIPGGHSTHGALLKVLTIAVQSNTTKALQMLKDRRRDWVAKRGHASSLKGPMHDEGNPMVECVGVLDQAMVRTYDINNAAETIQSKWRGFVGRSLLDTAHHMSAVARISKQYMYEQTTDHVRKVWEDDRRIEREEFMEYLRMNEDWIEPIIYTSALHPYTNHLLKILDPKK